MILFPMYGFSMMNGLPVKAMCANFTMMEYQRPAADGEAIGKRILVVEDEHAIADLIRHSLSVYDYDVEMVHDGRMGLNRAMSGKYALVILDLVLPGIDGLSICRSLRANGLATPVLILTGLGATAGIPDVSLHGAHDIMIKPFDVCLLQQRVRELIEAGSKAPPELRIGALLLDAAERTLTIDGAMIPLAPMEFSLLELLARYRGRVMTYRVLGEHLWLSTEVPPMAIDVLVNAIEIKAGRGIPISCIPHVGYRLD